MIRLTRPLIMIATFSATAVATPMFCSTTKHTDFALLAESDQNLLDLLHNHRRESFGRLVHNEKARVEKQRARNGEHLLLAAGELIATIGAPFCEARECLVDP